MLSFLLNCIRIFGFVPGVAAYVRIKVLKRKSFYVPGLSHPIFYRPGTVDVSTFREIFLRQEYAINLPETLKPKVIIDAGANIGFTSLFFLRRYAPERIISLEPDSGNFELLKKNTEKYPAIVPVQKALWYKEGAIEIIDKGYGLRGFTVEDAINSKTSLPATTFDNVLTTHKLETIDIVKMDIEGSEKEVFEGDTRWLANTRCLIIELHDRMKPGCSKAVFEAINRYNFDFSIRGENLVFIKRDF